MQVDLDQPLTGLDGEPFPLPSGDPATLKAVCVNALLTPQQEDQQAPSGTAYGLYILAQRVSGGGSVDLEAADVDLIKRRIERIYAPLVTGQAWDMLEQRTKARLKLA